MYGVASGALHFCCIECARHSGFEPTRMLMHTEYIGECDGCGAPLEPQPQEA